MFYSHTFLARKSPLGTVWMAAHLQHKLRKSHVSVTDISSTVDSIMCPQVPIALRLSAFLLLGVVRIYSKKVEYLYNDCNEVLTHIRTAFANIHDVNLPEDAASAPFQSITLPQTFELDALNIDDELDFESISDNHLKTYEEITMTDQIPGSQDPYVAFFINEDMNMDISPPGKISEIRTTPMEEDVPLVRENSNIGVSDSIPSNQAEELNQTVPDRLTEEIPETEVTCDAVHNSETGNLEKLPDLGKDGIEQERPFQQTETDIEMRDAVPEEVRLPQETPEPPEVMRDAINNLEPENLHELLDLGKDSTEQERPFNQTENENENLSLMRENVLVSGGQSASFQLHPDPSTTVPSGGSFGNFDSHISLGHGSLEMAIQPSPQVEKGKPKSRKRRQFFDMPVGLSNRVIKEGLKDASKLVCKRRKLPCSALDVWKFSNRKRMDQIFFESSNSGLSVNLQNLFKKQYIQEHTLQELRNADSPTPRPDADMGSEREHLPTEGDMENEHTHPNVDEIEHLPTEGNMENEHTHPNVDETEYLPTEGNMESEHTHPNVDETEHLPTEGNMENEHSHPNVDETEHLRFEGSPAKGDFETEFMASPPSREEFTPFPARNSESDPQTGNTVETQLLSVEQTPLTEPVGSQNMETPSFFSTPQQGMDEAGFSVPRLLNSAEDLHFLEADTTPAGCEENEPVDTLSVRTRAVAQYLKNQSPATEMSNELMGNLTLNKILEGKTRKQCARMFFETLVLTSYDLIKVQQEEAYGDITLLITSLSKTTL